jgi:hypothetical protein
LSWADAGWCGGKTELAQGVSALLRRGAPACNVCGSRGHVIRRVCGLNQVRPDLLMHLDHCCATHSPEFKWMIMFSRGEEKNLRALFPGDKPRQAIDDLYWDV